MSDELKTQDDPFAIPKTVNAMWLELANQIKAGIPEIVTSGQTPERAIIWATCAEACFWKATGDACPHDVKDVLPKVVK